MERYNPFASDLNSSLADGDHNTTTNPVRRQVSAGSSSNVALQNNNTNSSPKHSSRYSTSFPDPFATDADTRPPSPPPPPPPLDLTSISSTAERILSSSTATPPTTTSNRSNSVTFLDKLSDDSPRGRREMATAESPPPRRPIIQRGATTSSRSGGGLGSFLSRATSVTSNSVTGAMGSVRNAVVDSISTATAPSTPASLRSGGGGDQSTASYLASKFSSATNQLVGGTSSATVSQTQLANSTSSTTSPFAISRQRVVLILDSSPPPTSGTDHWPAQFAQYRRLLSGQTSTSNSLAFTAFFASQFSSQLAGGGGQQAAGEGDLIEQADLADVSVLANQSSSTAAVFIGGPSAQVGASTGSGKMIIPAGFFGGGGASGQTTGEAASQLVNSLTAAKIVRPEFVVVRQRARADKLDHLRDLVSALHYCCVPMFEPYECWHVFQDRALIFGRLLRVQMALGGKEHFPLIPQLYCQTHQDLLNYIGGTGAAISLPCLVRTGPQGKGKLRVESLQMLREFATIMATSGQSCTIEQQLDVKCDLIVQKLGTSLKLFRRQVAVGSRKDSANVEGSEETQQLPTLERQSFSLQQPLGESSSGLRQSASRQTSVGVLSSIISSTSSGLQQVAAGATRRTSNPSRDTINSHNQFEKLSEVNGRYRDWMEAIAREFNYKLDAFCLKIVVTSSDREYIVGLRNCSMDFLGSSENQEEDRRSFVELIISKMNTLLSTGAQEQNSQPVGRTSSGGEEATLQRDKNALFHQHQPLGSMARYSNDSSGGARVNAYGQLNNRSRSVSMNQAQSQPNINKTTTTSILPNGSSTYHSSSNNNNLSRRSSERADSTPTSMTTQVADQENNIDLMQQRQSSLGQSIFDQTSTAFSSFQNKSLSFLKRLDSRTGADLISSSSPLQTAKSLADQSPAADHHPIKSQSLETTSSSSLDGGGTRLPRAPPPKPPPPPPSSLISRQSSLAANYSSSSSPPPARQNSATTFTCDASQQQPTTTTTTAATRQSRVVRQNSALSAFEPFDPELRGESSSSSSTTRVQKSAGSQQKPPTTQFDNISTISANSSNSTDDTNASAEDTMNNLKKTFASIFGDKCD